MPVAEVMVNEKIRQKFPCRIIRIGDLYRVVTADLIRLLGVAVEDLHAPPKAA